MEFKTGELDRVLSMCAEAPTVPDSTGQTALFYAVQRPIDSEACAVVSRLLESGADAKRKDFGGQSPVFYAAACGNVECLKLLVNVGGCDPNEKDGLSQTPLFYAAREGKTSVVAYLLEECEVSPSEFDRNGQTPLFYAAREGRLEICQMLINFGASIHHRDLTGRCPSYFSRLNSHVAVTELLTPDSPADEEQTGRKRYRIMCVGGATPTAEQLDWLEEKLPNICVWNKSGLIVTSLVGVAGPTPASVSRKVAKPPATVSPQIARPIWMTAARQILTELFKKEDAWIFLRPVDPVRDMCADYYTVISSPMDFATMRKKMSKYTCKADFLTDCELVFSNCRTYNKPGTLPDILCQRVYAFYNQLIEQTRFKDIPDTPPNDQQ